jgi:RNA-binding protein
MYEFPLTGRQKTRLRALGQTTPPALKIGKAGLTPAFLVELQRHLNAAELVKLRFPGLDRQEIATLCGEIADQGRCVAVGALGHTALFYRQNPEPAQRRVSLAD